MNFWKQTADGFALFAVLKVIAISLDIITQPAGIFSPASFVAGAAIVASLLFVDYYVMETSDA